MYNLSYRKRLRDGSVWPEEWKVSGDLIHVHKCKMVSVKETESDFPQW